MKHISFFRLLLSLAVCVLHQAVAAAQEEAFDRPNILWLTFEDTSPYAFSCYGNPQTSTPTVDALAERGVRFTNCSSTAPHCSPARSSIISGSPATTYGTDWHRRGWRVPVDQYFFPPLLREAGYFTTNNSKTDYNIIRGTLRNKRVWNMQGNDATYNSDRRRPGQPFFAVFNSAISHMGRIRSFHLDERRDFEGLDPTALDLPPHVPDLPEIRSDYAFALEGGQDIDRWVQLFLDDISQRGLADDTIIFFFSDHGGLLPRGKAFPYESGLRVPMIVYVPPKWRDRCGIPMGSVSDRLINFEDLGPTVLALVGLDTPPHMQGRDFLGPDAQPRAVQFGFRTNTGPHYEPNRTAYDGRFKYIRSYTPYKPYGLRQSYQWGVPGQYAWDQLYHRGGAEQPHRLFFESKPTEQLYDLSVDPWETNNLADDSAYAEPLKRLRGAVSARLRETRDLGLFPNTTRAPDPSMSLYEWVRETDFPLEELYTAAELASEGDPTNVVALAALLSHEQPAIRFWGASGFATLANRGRLAQLPEALLAAMDDPNPEVSVTAAEAVCWAGEADRGLPVLLRHVRNNVPYAASAVEGLGPIAEPVWDELAALTDQQGVRSILINAGRLDFDAYYKDEYDRGARINRNRRDWTKPGPNP